MARQIQCPSCGASVRLKPGELNTVCPYCDSSIVTPDDRAAGGPRIAGAGETGTPTGTVTVTTLDTSMSAAGRSCRSAVLAMALFMVIGIGGLVFFLTKTSEVVETVVNGATRGSGAPSEPRGGEEDGFGGDGTGPGLFKDACCIGVDSQGRIYVGERETGRIQVFDSAGSFLTQWSFGEPDDCWLGSMAVSRDGRVYIVTGSELFVYDGMTGDSLGMLDHPDGWGFDDVTACPDGSIVASWYKNRDDIIRFDRDGKVDLVIAEAISSRSGDSELSTQVAVDGLGNIFAYGEFNGSVFRFDPEGRYQNRFGSEGERPGQYSWPSCIATDNLGNVWLCDTDGLIAYDGSGLYLRTVDPGASIHEMVIGDGNVLYGLTRENRVVTLDLDRYLEDL